MLTSLSKFAETSQLKNIGIQLFSVPKSLESDFLKTIKMLAQIGYTELEFFGPYPFSHQTVQDQWKAMGKSLGFSGSGYFGRNLKEVDQILQDHGLTAPSAHADWETLVNNMDKLGEAAAVLGHNYVALPAIPEEKRRSLDDYKRIAETFNRIGEKAKKEGIKFAYHNHGYGLQPVNGKIPMEIIFSNTDPELVFFEMDIFWTTAGGADPIDLLQKYRGRYHLLHLKDMKPKSLFSGDGSDPTQWMELFPLMTTAGDGELGVAQIVKTALSTGVKHFFVEQDLVANPEVALAKSFDFLNSL